MGDIDDVILDRDDVTGGDMMGLSSSDWGMSKEERGLGTGAGRTGLAEG